MIIETGIIISFATWLGSKIADKGFDAIYERLLEKSVIDDKFQKCVEIVATKFEKNYPDLLGNSIKYFFFQEEVFDELGKLLFINQEVNPEIISNSFDSATLPKDFILDFIKELKVQTSKDRTLCEILANKEIFVTVKGISKNIEDISSNSTLTYDEIKSIKQILEKQFKEKFNLGSFLSLYIKNLINNIGVVNFIGLGIDPSIRKGKRKELDSIFVEPKFSLISKFHIDDEIKCKKKYDDDIDEFAEGKLISFSHLFDRPYNYVILGNPGAGKSLLIKSIVLYIAKKAKHFYNERIFNYIPFRIELKNYLSFKKNKGGNLLKYIANMLEEDYSVPSVLEENLNEIFLNQKTILFFDGLDEIFNVNDKINVKNDIENFHNIFPDIRSITTSRFIGYNEAKLEDEKFCELNILAFSEEQIIEYVTKWYTNEEENIDIRNSEISDFISKMNKVDNELLSNPLLLSLIVILYRNNLKIPDSKLEIYQSCTNTLVDKWDASKNLDLQIDEHILLKKEPIFSDLAFWQYETLSSSNTEVTYYKAKSIVAESLIKKKIADEHNSIQLAEIFLNYAQKRSIYFDNNFTHKTFLEYYTAYWIYSNIEKKHQILERNNLISKYITNPFWYIVLELLLNLIDKDQPDTDILDDIITQHITNQDAFPFLLYILPNLKNLSVEVQKNVYIEVIIHLTSPANASTQNKKDGNSLFNRIQNNLIINSQQEIIIQVIKNFDSNKWNMSFFIFINELMFSPRHRDYPTDLSNIRETEIYRKAVKQNPYLYQIDNYPKSYDNSNEVFFNNVINYITLFGTQEIFKSHQSWFDSYYLGGYIHHYLFHQLKEKNISSFSNNLKVLEENELEKINLLEFLLKDRYIPRPDKESLAYMINIFDETVDEIEKTILVVILKLFFSERDYHRLMNEKISFEDFTYPRLLKDLLKKIIKLKNSKKIIDIIIKELNISDKKILELSLIISKNKEII